MPASPPASMNFTGNDPVQGVLRRLQMLWAAGPAAEIFGAPLRLYDQNPTGAGFPFIRFVRSERATNGSDPGADDSARGETITLTFNLWGRADQRARLDSGMAAMIAALDAAQGPLEGGGHLILALPGLSDVFLAEDGRLMRGILRVRAVVES